jgi:hypothetical protein
LQKADSLAGVIGEFQAELGHARRHADMPKAVEDLILKVAVMCRIREV